MHTTLFAVLVLTTALNGPTPRPLPAPLPDHPGNVFVAGEAVAVSLPGPETQTWRLLDYDDRERASVRPTAGRAALGVLPVGFYRLRSGDRDVSLAVLARLQAPTPATSPVALDVAMAWFYPKEQMPAVASLCALAGVNRVRDRLAWREMEPKPGEWSGPNRYDASAAAQARAGLHVLQVHHASPPWANPEHKRFPLDLRDAYRFQREMARRWRARVQAFEPWNEADIPVFGGHTGAEMASLQKAAALGLKAGNPEATACLNVFAAHQRAQLDDLHANQAWPYFDTFNLHHYAPFDAYPGLYADFRAVSAGRPLWVTECAMPVKWAGDAKQQEPSEADRRLQSERLVQVFAGSLHEGAAATFYFLLPHYVEGQTQFGVLRRDLTPRPAYVALAAVGRFLADARPLGRLAEAGTTRAFLFSARPDGNDRELLVAWATGGSAPLTLPVQPEAVHDHLGRPRPAEAPLRLTAAPLFVVLPRGTARRLKLQPPPAARPRLQGEPSPVVLQALWPQEHVVLKQSAYRLIAGKEPEIPLYAYHFGTKAVEGTLQVSASDGWKARLSQTRVSLDPQGRVALRLILDATAARGSLPATVSIQGAFGPAGQPVLSLRVLPPRGKPRAGAILPGSGEPARWEALISGNGPVRVRAGDGGVRVEATPKGDDRWVYPRLRLPAGSRPPERCLGVSCTVQLVEGRGTFRAIFDEANGSGYVAAFDRPVRPGQTATVTALFDDAAFGGGWSPPDANGRLDPDQIRAVKIGCNPETPTVTFVLKEVRWLVW